MASRLRSVGVDFGTTTSLVAEGTAHRQPLVLPLGRTTRHLPSLFGLDDLDRLRVADDATGLPPGRVKRSAKRCITRNETHVRIGDGTTMDADVGIRGILSAIAFNARAGGAVLSPETTRLGCPAMWTGEQRQRLLGLAGEAGLPVTDHTLIDEPVAAGVAWVQRQRSLRRDLEGKLLVFDMGGGTLDVALLDVVSEFGHDAEISVLSSWGIDEAGDSLDTAIAADLEQDLMGLGVAMDQLRLSGGLMEAARQAKIQLSTRNNTVVAVPTSPEIVVPQLAYERARLEIAFAPQLRRAEELVWAVLRGARVTHEVQLTSSEIRRLPKEDLAKDVDFVLLAGGMSRVPAVARLVERILPGVELHSDVGVPADESIVMGLAETTAYERVNLHRPPFSFVLEYVSDGQVQSVPVYDAYSPFYPPYFAMQRDILYHEWRGDQRWPRQGFGLLRLYRPGGESLDLRFEDDEHWGAVRVQFGHRPPAVLIYPHGKIVITDGAGRTTSFRIPRWPVIRGKDHAYLQARHLERSRRPEITDPRYNDPLFLH